MNVEIKISQAELFKAFFAAQDRGDLVENLQDRCRWMRENDTYVMDITLPSLDFIKSLREFGREHGMRGLMMQMTSLIGMIEDPDKFKIGSLKSLKEGVRRYLENGMIDGWLYFFNGHFNIPYLVTNVKYTEAEKGRSGTSPANVSIELVANAARFGNDNSGLKKTSIFITNDDIVGHTIPSMLLSHRFVHETQDLKDEYLENYEIFKKFYPQSYKQFSVSGKAFDIDRYDGVGKALTDGGAILKAINDEPLIKRKFIEEVENKFWGEEGNPSFSLVPFHPFLYMYLIDSHTYCWIHVSALTPYVYDPSLREKLILPEDHKDLIDILTEDLTILSDIVDSKTGGCVVICTGAPGTGKTLTAEIYSEVVGKPLYRVHTGLLGTTPTSVEEKLKVIMANAQRWGCILLIDEADTWVRERGNDIEQNAIIASFLKLLEAWSTILFMTSNRLDIDDAILSRCIAHIRYKAPEGEQRNKLWKTLSDNYKAGLNDETIKAAIAKWPNVVGRDIKELLKLSLKFAKKEKCEVNMRILTRCAQFRGL